jgi:hypothetical protein
MKKIRKRLTRIQLKNTAIAFYFGMRGSETAADKAAAALPRKQVQKIKRHQQCFYTSPSDGDRDIHANSLVTTSLNRRNDTSTINANTFTVKNDGTTTNFARTVH